MNFLPALLIGIVLGAMLGALAVAVYSGRRGPSSALMSDLAASRAALTGVREQLEQAHESFRTQSDAAAAQFRERLDSQGALYRERSEAQEDRLRELQHRLADLQHAEAERSRVDGAVLVALSPVAESLQAVQRKVSELEEQRREQYGELSSQLRSATESEERLRRTAESLASALTSNSTRGVWGEAQLRSVVEAAGLLERVDFDVQTSVTSDAGVGRPDMVVYLPGGKSIAVDAKVPFTAYLDASAIPSTASAAELARRDSLLKQHVKAVRDHISALGSKTYWMGLESSPEMVIAFIPSESLVASALEADPSILEFAFSKRVALSSPVTLWSVLKTVAFSWQQDVLTQDAKQVFDLSRELYSRIATTAAHVDKLGRSITGTVNDYNRFVGSLERQVLPSARKLNALDESKVVPELLAVEETTRELTAIELVDEIEAARRRIARSA
ncbi:DNA recombination protein RmuC [Planctomonas psychrotolerans]|uniref:DNA recombination protein RmuC n=1 Tax=Planctomonas psychrotolerans TaxID=2528712 RepID=UPI001239B4D0|nr:DNA recombination protein RmuC [Planctomonas psychrotolerans]